MIPNATYRLQFHKEFGFAQAAKLAPYFAGLGISHIYASPILTARAGSMHGYDVVDHSRINPELGGELGFAHLAAALKAEGIGIILDIVPNHMAVGGADNRWWLDVLQKGRASDYARFFDIDFDTRDPALQGRVLAPFLGAPYGEVLESGDLRIAGPDAVGDFAVAYHHHLLPIRPEDQPLMSVDTLRFLDPAEMHALLATQNFRLAWWRTAGDAINWRRFFDIIELAALNIDRPEVFDAVHAVPFALYEQGLIDGVRVDHVDGLADPAEYCRVLRARLDSLTPLRPADAAPGPAYIVVEKILGAGEALPSGWGVDGTSGYDFMNLVSALQHDQGGAAGLTELWVRLSGRSGQFDDEECTARDEILLSAFEGQLDQAASACRAIAEQASRSQDFTHAALRRALVQIIRRLRVYRTYATGRPSGPPPGWAFDKAVATARASVPAEAATIDFIGQVMARPDTADAVRRINQLTAPVAAKAVEDTAFYRYGRLLSRNDVGFEPGRLAMSVADFHTAIEQRAEFPHTMLATATHDHKRGEDVRARLAVLSEIPQEWQKAVESWFAINAALRPAHLAPDDEYQLYQTLVGTWPLDLLPDDRDGLERFGARVAGWQQKALREAKLRTSWTLPDGDYEAACRSFLDGLLDPQKSSCFLQGMTEFANRIAGPGVVNSLVQVILRSTVPGMPDLYQGTEFWDFSLVDPDNRRPVDYAARWSALEEESDPRSLAAAWRDGRIKQFVLRRLLQLRKAEPEFFARASYRPLADEAGEQAIAFTREHGQKRLLVVAPLHAAKLHDGSDGLASATAKWRSIAAQFDEYAGGLVNVLGGNPDPEPAIPAMILFGGD